MFFNRTLDTLGLGEQSVVQGVGGERAFRRRLLEMGLVPGTVVRRTGHAPLGDPLRFHVRGTCLSLRTDDARRVGITGEDT